jgi:hypothetical protein
MNLSGDFTGFVLQSVLTLTLVAVCLLMALLGVVWPGVWQRKVPLLTAWAAALTALLLACHELAMYVPGERGLIAVVLLQTLVFSSVAGLYQWSQRSVTARSISSVLLPLASGIVSLVLLACKLQDPESPVDHKHYNLVPIRDRIFNEATSAGEVRTDRGTPVGLYFCPDPMPWIAQEAAVVEAEFLSRVIRVEEANSRYNCHGWTFTQGRFHIRGNDALTLLKENGYYEVTDPRPGDVIAYWSHDQGLVHTGVVKFCDEQGAVVIESKWDLLGRYLHTPEAQPYSDRYTYLRTDRGSHLPRGLESVPDPVPLPSR